MAGTADFEDKNSLFGCHRNGAGHKELHCWHGDLSGSWEGKCGPNSLRIEDTLELLHVNGETRFARRWSGVRPGRRVRKARRVAGKGEADGKGGYPDYWPERSP